MKFTRYSIQSARIAMVNIPDAKLGGPSGHQRFLGGKSPWNDFRCSNLSPYFWLPCKGNLASKATARKKWSAVVWSSFPQSSAQGRKVPESSQFVRKNIQKIKTPTPSIINSPFVKCLKGKYHVGIAMPCAPSPSHHNFYGWYSINHQKLGWFISILWLSIDFP